jgi:predicted transcriptional regulator
LALWKIRLSPLTLRLEKKTRQPITRIANRRRISTSQVIREAVEAWLERQEPIASPYEAMADLIGQRWTRNALGRNRSSFPRSFEGKAQR